MPPISGPGVPLSVPVPLPLSWKPRPLGSVPTSLSVAVGKPVSVTVKVVPAVPAVNVVTGLLVMAGAWSTVRVKLWLAALTLLVATNTRL